MIWRRQHHRVTPAQVAEIAEARKATERVRREIESSRRRWPQVESIAARLREIRRENHLADDLHMIFSERRG